MRCTFFSIPAMGGDSADLNHHLATVRVLSVDRQFVANGAESFWAVCVLSHLDNQRPPLQGKKSSIDYKEVLSPEDFAIFASLREWRKALSDQEGVPVYSVFTNEQLAEIVTRRIVTLSDLQQVSGVGEARVRKFGNAILEVMASRLPATVS